jgi:hypothetical protein
MRKLRPVLPPGIARSVASVRRVPTDAEPRAVPPALPEPASPILPSPLPVSAQTTRNALVLRGDYWDVSYENRTAHIDDCRGLRYIALLIRDSRTSRGPIHARELVALATGQEPGGMELEMKDPMIDAAARKQLLARLEDIAEERDRACAAEDYDRAAALDAEHEQIADALSHTGRHGAFGNAGEKARKAVGKAVSEAIAKLGGCPDLIPLARHLTAAIQKGQWLSYTGSLDWHIDFQPPLLRK